MPIKYLSQEWIDEVSKALAAHTGFQEAIARAKLGLTFVVGDAPQGEVHYHFDIADGGCQVGMGDAENADATIKLPYQTAIALSKGDLNVQAAFIAGKLKVEGNLAKIMMNQGALTQYASAVAGMDLEY